jgi:hypothetical protein
MPAAFFSSLKDSSTSTARSFRFEDVRPDSQLVVATPTTTAGSSEAETGAGLA